MLSRPNKWRSHQIWFISHLLTLPATSGFFFVPELPSKHTPPPTGVTTTSQINLAQTPAKPTLKPTTGPNRERHLQTDKLRPNADQTNPHLHHRPRQGAGRSRGRRLAPARRRTRERPAPDHEQHHQTDEPPPVTTTAVPATDRQSQTVCHAPPLTPKPAEPHLTTRPHSHPHAATTDSSSPAPTANARQSTPRQPRPQAPAW